MDFYLPLDVRLFVFGSFSHDSGNGLAEVLAGPILALDGLPFSFPLDRLGAVLYRLLYASLPYL